MEQKLLEADSRTELKKGGSRRLRRAGKIPAILYGHGGDRPITVDAHDFHSKFRTISENTIINLKVEAQSFDVLVKDYQEDILTGNILHIDFFEIERGKVLRTNVPVHLIGTPVGVREGGILEHLLYAIDVECLPKDIPEKIEVNVENLAIGDSVHVGSLDIPESVRLMSSPDHVVVAVTTSKMVVEEEVEEEEIEGEEGEGEEGEDTAEAEEAEE